MEVVEDIVIVGAGIAGLTTALGLHRLGFRSLVLESWDSLRITGFAFTTWTNAWRALDAIGLGDYLRRQHVQLDGLHAASAISGLPTSELSFKSKGKLGEHEIRCVQRKVLLEALVKELPNGTIRYSSRVVSVEESGYLKLVHLADGSVLKTKVLIGCDGVNSMVAKWLGLKKPAFAGRSALRAYAYFKNGHGFEPKLLQFSGTGVRCGFIPCNDKIVYWFMTFTPSSRDMEKQMEADPVKMKQFALGSLGKVPDRVKAVVESTEPDSISLAPLRFRPPWELIWGNISKDNVCVAGDAFHPMTPDLGQGGCSALEDGVVLARCLADALTKKPKDEAEEEEEFKRIKMGLKKYAEERRYRGFDLIASSYLNGLIQQSDRKLLNFLRDKMAAFLAGLLLKKSDFDCGKLSIS